MSDEYNPENKGVVEIIKTPFQADPEIARQMVCGNANCIISGDGDFQMYIGASCECITTVTRDSAPVMNHVDSLVHEVMPRLTLHQQ